MIWGNYFRTGNASGKFQAVDRYVRQRLLRLLQRRGGHGVPMHDDGGAVNGRIAVL